MKLLFSGELDIHASALLPFLRRHGYKVTLINTSHWFFVQKIDDIPVHNLYYKNEIRFLFLGRHPRAHIEWLRKAMLYGLAGKTRLTYNIIKQTIKREGIEVIYGSWGSPSLPELRLLQKFHIPIVYEFLSYPTSISSFAVKLENTFNRGIINSLNGRVFATQRMLDYMANTFGIYHGRNMVFMECYSEKFFYRRRLPRLSESDGQPHLIFIGLDACDVIPQINEIIRRKIHVHLCDGEGLVQRLCTPKFRNFVHTFNKVDYRILSTFMTQFDGCLITYNFLKASTLDRFYNSVPNRFSLALTAGIPMIMPRGYLKGCEEIVNEHQIGFAYIGYDDLKNKLSDEALMDYYRRNAVDKSKDFTLENNFEKFDEFLKHIRDYAIT